MAAPAQSVRRSAAPPAAARKSPTSKTAAAKAAGKKSAVPKPAVSARGKAPQPAKAAPRQALAKSAVAKKKVAAKPARTPTVSRGKAVSPPKKSAPSVSLGRPKVVGEELLDLVFKEDFHARQIFVFLGVRTVRELEDFGPQQILDKAAQPLKETIDRIRRRLALLNRALRDDQEFAIRFLERLATETTP